MDPINYQNQDFENAKRYYGEKADFDYVANRLAEYGVKDKAIDAILSDLKKSLKKDIRSGSNRKMLQGFTIVLLSACLVLISSGYWFYSRVVGFIGIFIMIYGFVKIGGGLKIWLDIEDSSFFRQFKPTDRGKPIKQKKSPNKNQN